LIRGRSPVAKRRHTDRFGKKSSEVRSSANTLTVQRQCSRLWDQAARAISTG